MRNLSPLAAIPLAIAWSIPSGLLDHLGSVCLSKRLFSVSCAGCGLTRATVLGVHGQFSKALSLNPLVAIVVPLMVLAAAWGCWNSIILIRNVIPGRQLHQAAIAVWIILSCVLGALAIAPYVFSQDTLHHIVPECSAKANGGTGCVLCGMTSAYIKIAHGEWRTAMELNHGAIPLYAVSLGSLISAIIFLCNRRIWHVLKETII
jgi:hypothetical protein